MTRALLLLDVDGPLNPWAQPGHKRDRLPLPYKTLRLRPSGWEREPKPLRVWLSERHGPMLCRFAVEHDLSLAWATTWEHDANRLIAPQIGLPELPVIEFGHAPQNITGWKYPGVLEHAAGRPLVWFDDDFRASHFLRAQQDFLAARGDAPTLLHHVDPRLGLTELDLDQVGRWLDDKLPTSAGEIRTGGM